MKSCATSGYHNKTVFESRRDINELEPERGGKPFGCILVHPWAFNRG